MRIDIISLFPEFFTGPLGQSMMRKASEKKHASFGVHDLRQWGIGPRRQVDDVPYGGGDGMVLRPEPILAAIKEVSASHQGIPPRRIYLTPTGKPFTQAEAERLAQHQHLILLAGHYEGVDQRALDTCIDEEISIGDYVLTGGELPALVLIDAIVRLIPGVLGGAASAHIETFSAALGGGLEYPHYTRPETLDTPAGQLTVPPVLLSGHHRAIERWRGEQSQAITAQQRPDLS